MTDDLPNPESKTKIRGRGSSLKVANRFETIELVDDFAQLDSEDQRTVQSQKLKTIYLNDQSETIVSTNQSSDVDFNFSLNPYRGCVHGCSYCYARPSHEFLGFNAGIDFESRIVVKRNAPELFRKWLGRPKWQSAVEPIMLSGVTDCYQPCEKQFELTRKCLEVALDARQPIRITTKNSLIRRDLDLLGAMARRNLICVTLSVDSLDQSLIRVMEPRSSSPESRVETIRLLAEVGVPVKVLVAPIIPGINDEEIPTILSRVASAGAKYAGFVVLRLPLTVEPVFLDWLQEHFPDRYEKVVGRVKSISGGDQMYDSTPGRRMKGQGIWAEQIANLFRVYCAQHGLESGIPNLNSGDFRGPGTSQGHQQSLF